MKATVLLVEDNPGDARLAKEAVSGSQLDIDLTHVSSLASALTAVQEHTPDCIFLDLGLDDSEGLDGLKRLRAVTDRPIVILTVQASYDAVSAALEKGADDYLVKGELHEHTLEKTLRYALDRYELRETLRTQEARFRSLVEHAFDGVVVLDLSGSVAYASPVAREITGTTPDGTDLSLSTRIHPADLEAAADAFRNVAGHIGSEITVELRFRHADGSYRWLNARCRNRLDDPAVKGIVVNFHDDTERKNQEEATRQAEGRLRTLLRDVPAVVYTAEGGPAGRWLYVSPQIQTTLGFTPTEWMGGPNLWARQLHPEDAPRVHAMEAALLEASHDHPVAAEYRMIHRDGRIVWVRDVVRVLPGETAIGDRLFQGVLIDVTYEKEVEAELRESHDTYRALVQNSSDMVSLVDRDLSMVYVSPSIVRISGFSEKHFYGRPFSDGIHPEDLPQVEESLRRLLEDEMGPVELLYRRQRADGTLRWIDAVADCYRRNGCVTGLVVNSRDVTEAHDAEQARRESQELQRETMELFRGAFVASRTGIALIDAKDDSYVEVNDALCEMLGYPREELLSLDWIAVTHPDDRVKSLKEVENFRSGRDEVAVIHKRYIRKDGGVISVEIADALVRSSDGEPQYFVTHVNDVTERERAARALRESQQLLQAVIDNSPAVIYIKEADGRYVLVNDRYLEIFGFTADEVIGKKDSELFEASVADALRDNDRRVLEEKVSAELEEVVTHLDGEPHTYISVKFPLLDSHGNSYALCGISTDITERVKAENERARLEGQLRQSQKLEAVGQLAGGIAHDFNNLLSVILNYALFVGEDLGTDHPSHCDLDEITRAAELGGALTKQLLTFSRQEVTQPIVLELNQIIKGMERLLSRTIRESIELKTALEPDPWPVVADAGHLEQVLMNLAVNAKDAMPSGGTLSIETRNVVIDEAYASARPELEIGEYVCLSVSDTGSGMDEDTKNRIFEPFFTTKPKDRGTGLGLATVYSIVKGSGGYVTCYSEEGIGTTFKVYLPRSEATRLPLPSSGPREASPAHGRVILLAEDEAAVRRITVRILESAGYTVHAAESGQAALSSFAHRSDEIDLLITDMVMPGRVSGKALSDELGLPTLFVSGYTDNIITETGGLAPTEAFLQKPFTAEGLLAAAHHAIEKDQSSRKGVG